MSVSQPQGSRINHMIFGCEANWKARMSMIHISLIPDGRKRLAGCTQQSSGMLYAASIHRLAHAREIKALQQTRLLAPEGMIHDHLWL